MVIGELFIMFENTVLSEEVDLKHENITAVSM